LTVALDDIVDRILADARAQAELVLADAARQAGEILAAGKAEAGARTEAALAQAAGELEAEKNNRLAGVRLAARASVLALRRQLVDEVFSQVEQDLTRRPPEEYAAFLAALVPAEAARDAAAVVLGRDDLARLGPGFPGLVASALSRRHPAWGTVISRDPGDFAAGLHVSTPRSVHDLSLETLLAERREQWEIAVARILFAA
jgi:V/A-type H+-transporting ATPase subunit E